MLQEIAVYICDSAARAAQARAFLLANGYVAANLTIQQTTNFSYDATTYDGGSAEILANKFVVIGRK